MRVSERAYGLLVLASMAGVTHRDGLVANVYGVVAAPEPATARRTSGPGTVLRGYCGYCSGTAIGAVGTQRYGNGYWVLWVLQRYCHWYCRYSKGYPRPAQRGALYSPSPTAMTAHNTHHSARATQRVTGSGQHATRDTQRGRIHRVRRCMPRMHATRNLQRMQHAARNM